MRIGINGDFLAVAPPVTEIEKAAIMNCPSLKWDRANKYWTGLASLEAFNKLGAVAELPPSAREKQREIMKRQRLMSAERENDNPVPLIEYPVYVPMFAHQVQGANMALISFGWDCEGGDDVSVSNKRRAMAYFLEMG